MLYEADIRAVQQSLNDHGYDAGNVDGVWGLKTAVAMRKFQIDRSLQATGRLDAETRTALGVSNGAVSSLPSQVSSAAQ
jgi:N-acetylmuramoyl-L-alanine amidase